jgi:anti-sigma regulatory factor (Ser/Thr protein kinase)
MNVDLSLTVDPKAPSRARQALREAGDGIPGELLDDVLLLVTELVTNSVRHARLRKGDAIEVAVAVDDSGARCQVCDPGGSTEPHLLEAGLDDIEGRGLHMVDSLATRWGVKKRDRTCVWFELRAR